MQSRSLLKRSLPINSPYIWYKYEISFKTVPTIARYRCSDLFDDFDSLVRIRL